jgi:hypothetical protein
MMFIRPTILRDLRDGSYYTQRKYDAVRAAQIDASQNAIPLIGGTRSVLPPLTQPQELPPSARETPAGPAEERDGPPGGIE